MMQDQPSVESNEKIPAPNLTDWANEPKVLDLNADLLMAQPGRDETVRKVDGWLAMRNVKSVKNRKNERNKPERNRSTIQTKLVRRQAEWRYPALSEPFLASENTFKVKPTTYEDVKGAQQNQLMLNYQFRRKMNTVRFIDNYVRTVVDEGTCVLKVAWVRETKMVPVELPVWEYVLEPKPEYIEQLNMWAVLMTENPQGYSELPPEIRASVEYSIEMQVPAVARQVGSETVMEEKIIKNHPTADIVDYRNFYLDPSAEGDIDKANFAIMSFESSKAELKKDQRYKNLDKVNWGSQSPLHVPEHISKSDHSLQFKDEARKRIVVYEYWGFYDIMGDGVLVPIVASWIGSTMIRMELNPFPDQKLPFVVVPYMPVKDSVTGEPDAELLEENQAVQGALMRGIIDLMGRSANGQTGFAKNMLDPVNRAKFMAGDDYEFNPGTDPSANIYQHKYPDIPASALQMLAMQDQQAEALTGVKAFSGGLSGEAYGQVAAGVRGLLDAASKREMSILRRLAQGISEVGSKFIAMNGAFLSDKEVIEVTNEEYVEVSREDLQGEFNTLVEISTPEVDEAQAQDIGMMMQTLGNTIPFQITQKMLAQLARLKRMPELAKEIEIYKPEPDPLAEKMKELQIAELEAKIAELHAQAALHNAKARVAASEGDLKDLDFLETETGTKHAREMQKVQSQAESNQLLKITERILDPTEPGSKPQEIGNALQLHTIASAST